MSFSKSDLLAYRIEKATEALEDGRMLAEARRWNAAANRFYYACFHIISAFALHGGHKATTHSGLKVIFNKELILTGQLSKEDGRLFNYLFTMRQEADYEDLLDFQEADIVPLIIPVGELIESTRKLLV